MSASYWHILADFIFRAASDMAELPEIPYWNPKNGTAVYDGDAKCRWQWRTFADAGAWTIDVVTHKNAENGGVYSILSDAGDVFYMVYMAWMWKEVTGKDIKLIAAGEAEELREYCNTGKAGTFTRSVEEVYWILLLAASDSGGLEPG